MARTPRRCNSEYRITSLQAISFFFFFSFREKSLALLERSLIFSAVLVPRLLTSTIAVKPRWISLRTPRPAPPGSRTPSQHDQRHEDGGASYLVTTPSQTPATLITTPHHGTPTPNDRRVEALLPPSIVKRNVGCTLTAIARVLIANYPSVVMSGVSPSSSGLLPMPGSPSSSWAVYKARIAAVLGHKDMKVIVAFWLFGRLLIPLLRQQTC